MLRISTLLFAGLTLFHLASVEGFNNEKASCYNYQLPGCPFNFAPVCGSNGVTYANECVLCETMRATRRKILVAKSGPC